MTIKWITKLFILLIYSSC